VVNAVGELTKHLAAVEKVGADFIPLVVETFEVWTLFVLNTKTLLLTEPPPLP